MNKENKRRTHAEYMRTWSKTEKGRKQLQQWKDKNRDRVRTYDQIQRKRCRDWFNGLKHGMKCSQCGEDHPSCLDFHHVNPSDKVGQVRNVLRKHGKKAAIEEMKKCIVLCANCHRKVHYNQCSCN